MRHDSRRQAELTTDMLWNAERYCDVTRHVRAFAQWALDNGVLEQDELLYFFDKPWKWGEEFQRFCKETGYQGYTNLTQKTD